MLLIWPTVAAVLTGLLLAFGHARYAGWGLILSIASFYLFALVLVRISYTIVTVEWLTLTPRGIEMNGPPYSDYKPFPFSIVGNGLDWDQIDPVPRGPVSFGFVNFRINHEKNPLPRGPITLSPTQARAMLTYPSCPRKPLPPKTIRLLGLPSDWPVAPPSK
jgi:hypothetical protein